MSKSDQILDQVIATETSIAETREALEELETDHEKLTEQVNEDEPTWSINLREQLSQTQATLMDSQAQLANSVQQLVETITMQVTPQEPSPETQAEQLTPPVSETEMNSSTTTTGPSSETKTEAPAENAVENLVSAVLPNSRQIHKI